MTKLNQLLAIEKGVSQTAHRALTDAYHVIQRAPLFHGLTRNYQPTDDEGEQLPSESTRVQQSVPGLVASLREPLARLFDVVFEKDKTNCVATADVVVDGTTIVEDAPVTYLLWLEKRLNDLKTFVEKWPTLDPSAEWRYDPANLVFATDAIATLRTTKVPEPILLYPATEKHPAQVQVHNKDITVGTWTTVKLSGAASLAQRQATLERVEKLLAAVRQAREAANSIDVATTAGAGDAVLGYLFQPIAG